MFLLSVTLATETSFAQFSGSGTGTASDPYKIFNPAQLAQVKNFCGKENVYFELLADIDLTEWISKNSPTQGWSPIGTSTSAFMGIFKGNNHTISGMRIDRSGTSYLGFFGYTNGATISDLRIVGEIMGYSYAGLLSGYSSGGAVTNCSSEGTINCSSLNVGGLIGHCSLTVDNCSTKCVINGASNCGGMFGNLSANATNLNVEATITGTENVGGLVGNAVGCDISSVVVKTKIGATGNNVGGIVGFYDTSYLTSSNKTNAITSCRADVDINSTGNYIGGAFGQLSVKTYHYLYDSSIYHKYCAKLDLSSINVVGNISGNNNVGGLIGLYSANAKTGSYYYYYTPSVQSESTALGTISNSSAIGTIIGSDNVGGILGQLQNVSPLTRVLTITDSYSNGAVKGNDFVGGVVGNTDYAKITNNYTSASISGAKNVGGISGTVEILSHALCLATLSTHRLPE